MRHWRPLLLALACALVLPSSVRAGGKTPPTCSEGCDEDGKTCEEACTKYAKEAAAVDQCKKMCKDVTTECKEECQKPAPR